MNVSQSLDKITELPPAISPVKKDIKSRPRRDTLTLNLHTNFTNLNPAYAITKLAQINKISSFYKNKLGSNLKEKIEGQKRKNFNEFLQNGGRLTYEEIKNLS
jgi:hypothetical protein